MHAIPAHLLLIVPPPLPDGDLHGEAALPSTTYFLRAFCRPPLYWAPLDLPHSVSYCMSKMVHLPAPRLVLNPARERGIPSAAAWSSPRVILQWFEVLASIGQECPQ